MTAQFFSISEADAWLQQVRPLLLHPAHLSYANKPSYTK